MVSVLLAIWVASARGADLVWTNTAGGSWNTAANWSPNQVPTSTDHVWITNNSTYTVTVTGGGAAGILTIGGSSGTQTLALNSGVFVLGSGTGNSNAVLRIAGGTLGGNGSMILAGQLNWTSGTITNTVQCAGGSISGSGTKYLRYGCLINTSVLTFSGGYLELYSEASISNLASATFDIIADCDISYYSTSSGPIYNAGLFRKSAGTSTTLVGAHFYNTGTLSVQSGTLRLAGGGDYSGTIIVSNSCTLSFYGGTHNLMAGPGFSYSGTMECSGSAVVVLGSDIRVAALNVSGGILTGSGSITAERLTWSRGRIECTVYCNGGTIPSDSVSPPELRGGRLVNTGGLKSGLIVTKNGAIISNTSTGVFDFTNTTSGVRHDAGAYGGFYNSGLVCRSTVPENCWIGEPFYNSGTVEVQNGQLGFSSQFIQTAGVTKVGARGIAADQGMLLNGGLLVGTNTVCGNVTNNACINPGDSAIGRLTIEGTYAQGPAGRLQIEISGPTPGTDHDQLVVTNLARLGGTLEVTNLGGFVPGVGVVITALVCNVRSGTFDTAIKPTEYYVVYMPTTVLLETENAPPIPRLSVETIQRACHPFAMQATATDPDGTVTNLTLLLDGVVVANFPGQVAGSAVACTDFPGEVMCTARATDNKGAMGETNIPVTVVTLPVHVLDPIGFQSNQVFKLCMCGETGSNYVIEATTNLPTSGWTVLGTMENTNGIWRFNDATTTNASRRFYRARQL